MHAALLALALLIPREYRLEMLGAQSYRVRQFATKTWRAELHIKYYHTIEWLNRGMQARDLEERYRCRCLLQEWRDDWYVKEM